MHRSHSTLPLYACLLWIGLSASITGCGSENANTTLKGERCFEDSDCAETNAICREANADTDRICTGDLSQTPFETPCTASTALQCAGLACHGLPTNNQNQTGLCTMPCTERPDCGNAGVCASLGNERFCLAACNSNADCSNGFVCVEGDALQLTGQKVCYVTTS